MSRRALIVGINYYNTEYRLNGCINDANLLKNTLLKIGYKKHNITMMTDQYKNDLYPTKKNIIREINKIISSNAKEIFFAYSGHGSKYGNDEVIFPVDDNVIYDDLLYKLLVENLPRKKKLYVLMDCCNSGSLLELPFRFQGRRNKFQLIEQNHNINKKVILISGCKDNQTSGEIYYRGKNNGALTIAFTSILLKHHKIATIKLLRNIRKFLRRISVDDQKPQLTCGYKLQRSMSYMN